MTQRSLVTGLFLASMTMPTMAMAVQSAELYRTQAYFYGRFEARVQYAPGDGVVSSFFLWRDGSSSSSWNEIDYEKLNVDCRMQTNVWSGAAVQKTQINAMPGNICTGYHTYSFEWTPTYIAWFVDGCEIRRETSATILADYTAHASAGMTFHFNVWEGNASFGGPFSASILPVNEYISWVQYSSYVSGSTFQLQWREEFTGTGVPSGWAEGNWASPYGLSTHNPANVNYVNGIAVLSMTADGATGYTGTPPADSGGPATCGAGTGGATGTGGASATGGTTATGGSKSTGGATATGGTTSTGGSKSTGGTSATGGAKSTGGASATGGVAATGGSKNTGGTTAIVGTTTNTGGALTASGGLAATGGGQNAGGSIAIGGSATVVGSNGGTVAATGGATGIVSAGASAVAGATGGPGTGDNVGSCSCKISESRKSSPMRGVAVAMVGLGLLLTRRIRRSSV